MEYSITILALLVLAKLHLLLEKFHKASPWFKCVKSYQVIFRNAITENIMLAICKFQKWKEQFKVSKYFNCWRFNTQICDSSKVFKNRYFDKECVGILDFPFQPRSHSPMLILIHSHSFLISSPVSPFSLYILLN